MRKYGKDYAERLSQSGLTVTENFFVKNIDGDLIKKHALPENEIIFYCFKGN